MNKTFSDISNEALKNSENIVDQCNLVLENSRVFLPKYEPPPDYDLNSWLRNKYTILNLLDLSG